MTQLALAKYVRDIPDFPKKGILFKDLTPLLQNPEAFRTAEDCLFELAKEYKIDKVVGIESRGFLFGSLLASRLGAGFVPVRKPGKLPHATLSESYALEYGTDRLEIHRDAIRPGEQVLLHDDLLATGGTAAAACKLIQRLKGNIVQVSFLLELSSLRGRERLTGYPVNALITY